jgi:hypothetical protein
LKAYFTEAKTVRNELISKGLGPLERRTTIGVLVFLSVIFLVSDANAQSPQFSQVKPGTNIGSGILPGPFRPSDAGNIASLAPGVANSPGNASGAAAGAAGAEKVISEFLNPGNQKRRAEQALTNLVIAAEKQR